MSEAHSPVSPPSPPRPGAEPPTREGSRLGPWQLAYLALYVLLLFAPGWLRGTGLFSAETGAWIGVVRYVILAGFGLWLFRDAIGRSLRLTRQHPWRAGLWTLAAIIGGELVPMIPAMLLAWLDWLPATMTNDDAVGAFGDRVPAIVFFVTLAVLGPITEELVYREALIQRTRSVASTWMALIISSLLFGLLHVHTVEELPLALVYGSIGLVYGGALIATRGNLLVPVVGHSVHNGIPAFGALFG